MTTATPSPWPRYQPPHRHLADEQIRADGAELPAILKHPLVPANDPELVTTDAQLAALLHRLRDEGRFAYDTEFIGEPTHYRVDPAGITRVAGRDCCSVCRRSGG